MTTKMGGAMDRNHVEDSLDDFDALLDASSLGAPRAQVVRRHTPTAVRELLASRLAAHSAPAPDAASCPATPQPAAKDTGLVTEPAWLSPPRLSAPAGPVREPRYRNGSHYKSLSHFLRIAPTPTFYERILSELRDNAYEPIPDHWKALTAAHAYTARRWETTDSSIKAPTEIGSPTRLYLMLRSRSVHRRSSLGQFGIGLNVTLALMRPEPLSACGLSAALLLNGRALGVSVPIDTQGGWPHRREPLPLYAWDDLRDSTTRPAAALAEQTVPAADLKSWLPGVFPTASSHRPHDRVELARHRVSRANDVFCKLTSLWADEHHPWWLRTDLDTRGIRQRQHVAVFMLSHEDNNTGRNIPDYWPVRSTTSHYFLVRLQAAPRNTPAMRDRAWDQLVHGIHALVSSMEQHNCLAAQLWRNDLFAAPTPRQATPPATASPGQDTNPCWSPHGQEERMKLLASMHPWPANPWHTPARELIVVTHTPQPPWMALELPWAALGKTSQEQAAASLPTTPKLALPAAADSTAPSPLPDTTLSCHTVTTQGATTVRATTDLILVTPEQPITIPTTFTYRSDDPYAVHAVFENPSGEQSEWTFARDLLVEGMNGSSGSGDVWVGTTENRTSEHAEPCVYICLRVPEGEALLQARQADLRQFLDRTRELIGYGREHTHMQPALDTITEELLRDPHLH
ncbi:SsgA family sporulation/cell division regulator [Streptomyces apocyni]|uniref:SsgA family sporulation/cell division regulator n=1 Tax=Streptomyces apocyni TaxID=2654677 RepID=UPI0012EA60B3|nr:SsgA family sporulation/cell division regulator [Streptomyces apocyni]